MIGLITKIYCDAICDLADEIVRGNSDLIEIKYNEDGEVYPDSSILEKKVKDIFWDMCVEDRINIIKISPHYIKMLETEKGVNIEPCVLTDLFSSDNDNILWAVSEAKDIFVFQHENIVNIIIQDIKLDVETISEKNFWDNYDNVDGF